MLQAITGLKGFAIEATDGQMGAVVDFLFDDASWRVSWLVVECGSWLRGRKVLIHPSAVSYTALADEEFNVDLTKAQVESSPEWGEHQPVSQRMERQLYEHYGWDPLWDEAPNPSAIPGAMASPLMAPPNLGLPIGEQPHCETAEPPETDMHLRSVSEVIGYHLLATDGEIGHVENFLIDAGDWGLHYFVADTGSWWLGKQVLIAPCAVQSIDWSDRHVHLDVTRKQVEESPPWDPLVVFDEVYAKQLHSHYGWPGSGA